MGCETISVPGGGVAIACSRGRGRAGRCIGCGGPATHLCDARVNELPGDRGTCSKPLCGKCTRKHGGLDYCPTHDLERAARVQQAAT